MNKVCGKMSKAIKLTISLRWFVLKDYIKPFCNIKFCVSFFLAWMITNGWSYIALALGTYFKINWLIAIAGSYQAFLWLPCTPEKLITIPIAIWIHKKLFKKDFNNLHNLTKMYEREKKKTVLKK